MISLNKKSLLPDEIKSLSATRKEKEETL